MKMCPQCLLQSFHEKYLGHLLFCQGGFVIFFTVCNKMLTFIKNANLIVKGKKNKHKNKRESVCVTTPHYSRIIINETKLCYRPDPTSSAGSIFICCDLSQQERVFICRRCGLSKRKLLVKWKHTRPSWSTALYLSIHPFRAAFSLWCVPLRLFCLSLQSETLSSASAVIDFYVNWDRSGDQQITSAWFFLIPSQTHEYRCKNALTRMPLCLPHTHTLSHLPEHD